LPANYKIQDATIAKLYSLGEGTSILMGATKKSVHYKYQITDSSNKKIDYPEFDLDLNSCYAYNTTVTNQQTLQSCLVETNINEYQIKTKISNEYEFISDLPKGSLKFTEAYIGGVSSGVHKFTGVGTSFKNIEPINEFIFGFKACTKLEDKNTCVDAHINLHLSDTSVHKLEFVSRDGKKYSYNVSLQYFNGAHMIYLDPATPAILPKLPTQTGIKFW
jgi:hypothetical protein